MQESYEQIYHEIERTDWWYVARRDFIYRFLKKQAISADATILDIGCSTGELMDGLQKKGYSHVTGIDISEKAINACKARGISNVHVADAQQLEQFKDESFDIVVASDVLEHLDDDRRALQEWRRVLTQNGTLIIFVPAFPMLWSKHDELNQHKRRYTKKLLRQQITQSGLRLKTLSFWNSILFLPYTLAMKITKRNDQKEVTIKKTGALTNALLLRLLKFENKCILSSLRFPFGVSLLAITKKS